MPDPPPPPASGAGSSVRDASTHRSAELENQLRSIYDTLPNSDFKQLLMVFVKSTELIGSELVTVIKEFFPSVGELFADVACTRTTLRILRELLKCRGVNVDCRQGVKISVGVAKALYGSHVSVSADAESLLISHVDGSKTGAHSRRASAVESSAHDETQNNSRGSVSHGSDVSRLAHNVSNCFKDYKYDGSLEEPIAEYVAEYDAVAKDFDLSIEHKLRFFHVVFSGAAKRFYFSRVEPAARNYMEAKGLMTDEFNSPSRQQRILQVISTLKFRQIC